MLAIKRCGFVIKPGYFDRLIGKKARNLIKKNQAVTWNSML